MGYDAAALETTMYMQRCLTTSVTNALLIPEVFTHAAQQ